MSKTAEEIEDLAIEYADSKERRMTSAWQGLKFGFIAGYSSKDSRIKELEVQISGKTFFDEKETMAAKIQELEARLETAEKVIKRTDTWLKGRGKDFQEDIEYEIKKYQTQNKTE